MTILGLFPEENQGLLCRVYRQIRVTFLAFPLGTVVILHLSNPLIHRSRPRAVAPRCVLRHDLLGCREADINIVGLKLTGGALDTLFIAIKRECAFGMNAKPKAVVRPRGNCFTQVTFLHHDGGNQAIVHIVLVGGVHDELGEVLVWGEGRVVTLQKLGDDLRAGVLSFKNCADANGPNRRCVLQRCGDG